MRRALFLVTPLALGACGLILDFDGLSDNVPADASPAELPDVVAPGDRSVTPSSPCEPPERAIGCELDRVDALAATDAAVLWISGRGAVLHSLATSKESIVKERPPSSGASAIARGDALVWGFRTSTESAIWGCDGRACEAPVEVAKRVAYLNKLAASSAGLYAWAGDGVSRLLSVDAGVDFEAPMTGDLVTHFTVSDQRAFWRLGPGAKGICALGDCAGTVKPYGNGQPPFAALSGDKGFVSIAREREGGAMKLPYVRNCFDFNSCELVADVPFDVREFDQSGVLANPNAVAVANDVVYAAAFDGTKQMVHVIRTAAALGTTDVQTLLTVPGDEVAALAVNTTMAYVAVREGNRTVVYAAPRDP